VSRAKKTENWWVAQVSPAFELLSLTEHTEPQRASCS